MNNFGSSGSTYFSSHHYIFQRRSVTSCGDVTCVNGCCKNNPCQNGGKCTEICEPTSVRYNCSCSESFLADTVNLKEKAARPIRLQAKGVLDCTQSLMTAVNPSKCFVTLNLSQGLHGT